MFASTIRWKPLDHIPELTCKCGCGACNMDKDFMLRFQKLRSEWYSKTGKDLIELVSSGYRCNKWNKKVSKFASKKDGSGPHTKGKAVDIKISGTDAGKFFRIAKKHMTGIGLAQRGRRRRSKFIHLDSLTPKEARRPAVWVYKR